MYTVQKSTSLDTCFFAHDTTGAAVTGMTNGGFTKRISKNGAAWGAMTVTITEMENGWYGLTLSSSHTDTLGILSLTFTNASCMQVNLQFRVEANLLDSLATAANLATVQADTDDIQTRIPAALVSGRMDSSVGAMAADTLTASALATDAVTEITGGVWNATRASYVVAGSFGQGAASVQGNVTGSVASVTGAVGSVTGNVGGNVVGSTASVTGAVGSVTGNVGGNVVGSVASVSGNVSGSVGSVAASGITASSFAADAITSSVLATDSITSAQLAASAVTEIQTGLATSSSITTVLSNIAAVQSDTDDIQTRLPAALVSGRIDASVGAMAADTLTASALATDAVNEIVDTVWDELRADHVTSGTFGQGAASVQGNVTGSVASVTGNVGGNVVGSTASVTGNVGGNVTGSVGSVATGGIAAASFAANAITSSVLATDSITSAQIAASAVTEIQTGLATSSALATVQADTDDIQTRLPAALVGGRMDSSVGAMAANTLTASALATDAVNEIVDQVWDEANADHVGAGSTGLALSNATAPTAATVADAVWDELIAGHLSAGSTGESLNNAVAPSAGTVASAVWEEARSGHTSSGTFGQGVASVVGSTASIASGGITTSSFASGAIDSTVLATDSITSAQIAASAVTEIQTGLATSSSITTLSSNVASVQSDTDNIQTRLPASLVSGRMDSSVGAMAADTLTASALATDAVTEITTAVNTELSLVHGAGVWDAAASLTVQSIVDGILEEILNDHISVAGSVAEAIAIVKGLSLSNYALDNTTYDSTGLMTSGRIRVFSTNAGAQNATQGGSGEGELASFIVSSSAAIPGRPDLTKVVKQ